MKVQKKWVFKLTIICVADEYVMLVKGAETAVLDRLASGPRDDTLDHVNEYAEVCIVLEHWNDFTLNRPVLIKK